eukprot:scaffold53059_cov33-Phaeocystis_antarctica.AAC.2
MAPAVERAHLTTIGEIAGLSGQNFVPNIWKIRTAKLPLRSGLEGGTGKIDLNFSNYGGYTNYAYEHVAHSETEHLA